MFSPTSPLHSTILPGFNIVNFRPQDIMHLEGASGNAHREAGSVIHRFTKVLKQFTIGALNTQLARYPRPLLIRLHPCTRAHPCIPALPSLLLHVHSLPRLSGRAAG